MALEPDSIHEIDLNSIDQSAFKKRCADCIILTSSGQLLLQQKPEYWNSFPGYLMAFGGHVEDEEEPIDAVCREIHEEVGAVVKPNELTFIAAVTEKVFNHEELLSLYFWHDENNRVTGCYEGEAHYYDNVDDALGHPKVMDYLRWSLVKAQDMGLIS